MDRIECTHHRRRKHRDEGEVAFATVVNIAVEDG